MTSLVDRIHDSILDTIGNTPIVRIQHLCPKPGVRLLAKLEGFNPLGSVKERIALAMIEAAERDGRLAPGQTVVEGSSGNTGIGLAMVCALKGYPLIIAMPQKVSVERRAILRALGAELVFTSETGGTDEAWDIADALCADDRSRVRIHQYTDDNNWWAHYRGTAREIWRQTAGEIDVFVAGLGTTGTIVGVGRRLKELRPEVQVVAVEPEAVHSQQGLRNVHHARRPAIFDPSVVDRTIVSRDESAFATARLLARREGIFAGISSGAAMAGALEVVDGMDEGTVVVLLPDRGDRYLSTALFADPGDQQVRPEQVYDLAARRGGTPAEA